MLPDHGELAEDLQRSGVEVMTRPLGVIRRSHLSPRGMAGVLAAAGRDGTALASLVRRRGIAIVHSNTSVVPGGAIAATLARVPHVWHIREIYDRFPRVWPAYKRLLETAHALPCVSSATAAQFGANPRARVIYDGLATDAFRAPERQARAKLGP
jgi:hypothetical protein